MIGDSLLQRYNATITILIESGVLYSTYMILDLAFQNDPSASTILDAGLIQVVGIMPTLIIVQVGLGRAIHENERGGVGSLNAFSSFDPRRASSGSNLHKPLGMSLGSMGGGSASRTFIVNAPSGDHDRQQREGGGSIHDARSFREAIRSHRDRTLSETSTINTTRSRRPASARRVSSTSTSASQKKQALYDMGNDNYTMPMPIPRHTSSCTSFTSAPFTYPARLCLVTPAPTRKDGFYDTLPCGLCAWKSGTFLAFNVDEIEIQAG
ncbi:hypothetical protein MD484_g2304, partial [Candolleomyces efflorescens]